MRKSTILFIVLILCFKIAAQGYQIAVLKYNGGGDYYANPTALPNLIKFCNTELGMNISKEVPYVEVGSTDLFQYPLVHMTGHGNVVFSRAEANNLRTYLLSGGFLHIDDNYGMDGFVRAELKKVFPEATLIELPTDHLFQMVYQKFMSTTAIVHRLLESLWTGAWFVCIPTKLTSQMAGKILRCTMTHQKKGAKLYRWAPILFLMLFPINADGHRAHYGAHYLHL